MSIERDGKYVLEFGTSVAGGAGEGGTTGVGDVNGQPAAAEAARGRERAALTGVED